MIQETGARINVPPPSVNKTEIVITGEKEQVALAVALIKKVYEEKVKLSARPEFPVIRGALNFLRVKCDRSTPLFFIAEEERHHNCSGGEEISAQVCDWPQGKHPAGNPG